MANAPTVQISWVWGHLLGLDILYLTEKLYQCFKSTPYFWGYFTVASLNVHSRRHRSFHDRFLEGRGKLSPGLRLRIERPRRGPWGYPPAAWLASYSYKRGPNTFTWSPITVAERLGSVRIKMIQFLCSWNKNNKNQSIFKTEIHTAVSYSIK